MYVGDYGNNAIRVIATNGAVTTLAGTNTSGFVNAAGTSARFYNPLGVAVDFMGNVYVADLQNNNIRMIGYPPPPSPPPPSPPPRCVAGQAGLGTCLHG